MSEEIPTRAEIEELIQKAEEAHERYMRMEFKGEPALHHKRERIRDYMDSALGHLCQSFQAVYNARDISIQEVYKQELSEDVREEFDLEEDYLSNAVSRPFTIARNETHTLDHETLLNYGFGGLVA